MSYALSATDTGIYGQLVGNTSLIKREIAQLSAETSSGYVSQDFAGLGAGVSHSLDLSAQLSQNGALQGGLDQAANVQQVTQTALGQIESIASNFAAEAAALQTTPGNVATLSTQAQDALQQLGDLLNTQVGDQYVFAGQDSRNPPVPNPTQITGSAFYGAISAAVAGLSVNGAAAVASQTLTATGPGATSPFAATLEASNAPNYVATGPGQVVQVGVLADRNTDAASAGVGVTSTGSYTRDLFRNLAILGSLTPAQASDPNFQPLVQNVVTSLQGVVSAVSTDIGGLGTRQTHVTGAKSELVATATALTTQLGNVQDADLTTIATQLSAAQTQLQASYQVIAGLGNLSLAKFLPAA